MEARRIRRAAVLAMGTLAVAGSALAMAGCGQNDMPKGSGNGVIYYTGVMRSKADLLSGKSITVAQSTDVRQGG